jgi:predicted DNA-binding transcriptional regulator AlpA
MRKRKIRVLARKEEAGQGRNFEGGNFIPAPKLRAKLGISAVTLWRWRHDKKCSFPSPTVINGRLYFPVTAVSAWIAKHGDAA